MQPLGEPSSRYVFRCPSSKTLDIIKSVFLEAKCQTVSIKAA